MDSVCVWIWHVWEMEWTSACFDRIHQGLLSSLLRAHHLLHLFSFLGGREGTRRIGIGLGLMEPLLICSLSDQLPSNKS